MKVTVECAAVARATCRQLSRLVAGNPQLVTMRWPSFDNSKASALACASWLSASGGGVPVSISTSSPLDYMR